MKKLNKKELELISMATLRKTGEIGLKHAKLNSAYIKQTIRDIGPVPPKPALVISAGPSLHSRRSLKAIKESNFKGHIVAVDGTLGHCLRNGIVPDYVITVDPHPHRIIRWFGDTHLSKRPDDDYFRRQDLDPALNKDEIERNDEMIRLVNLHGPGIKVIISTSVSPEITRRCLEAGMQLYWWNPLYDDFDDPGSYSRKIHKITKTPCMVTGGNCGTSAWVFSHAVLASPEVVVVGMDLSYPPGTTVDKTQYYDVLKELFPGEPERGLIKVHNPHLKQSCFTDPAYYWYTQSFLEMAKVANCRTYNCTEGGILFGKGVIFSGLSEVLNMFAKRKS
ncbi:MAG: DUF115 domain-containing protein [Candidatus Omnitrophica bacterium]|nr:DUF115 domain-containing protein [Candidatus Omnitrophota bacterium]MDD5310565.1 DUF115 domain-containing protein [Candidatus Omnitrophota bacterium]MDD5546009.1 DUF115 domain-containing protein [Candidatus Omnitrophota bacterium]